MRIKYHLKTLLFISSIATIFIPLMIMSLLTYYVLTDSLKREVTNKNSVLARSIAGEIDIFLDAQINVLQQLIYDINNGRLAIGSERIKVYLESIMENHAYFNTIMILDNAGKVKNIYPYNRDYINFDMSGQPFFKETKKSNSANWSPVSISIDTGQPTTVIAIPFGQGVIVGYLDLSSLRNIAGKIKLGDNGYSMVVDQSGTIIAHKDFQLVKEQLNIKNLDFIQKAFEGRDGTYTYQYNELERLGSIALVPKTKWLVVITQPTKDIFEPINQIKTPLIAGFTVLILFAMLISISLSRRLIKPLVLFKEKTKMLANGEYSSLLQSSDFNAYSEIDELAQNFNKMAGAVKSREETLKIAQFSIDNASDAIFWGDSNGKLLYVNEAACKLLGYEREDLIHKHLYNLDVNYNEEEFFATIAKLKLYGFLSFTNMFKKANGEIFPADVTASLLQYGGEEYFFAFLRDISKRKHAEKALFEEKELLAVTLRSIGEGVISTDIEGRVILMNKVAENIIGWLQNEALGKSIEQVVHISDMKAENHSENLITKIMEMNMTTKFFGKNILIARDGVKKIILLSIMPVKDRDSAVIGMVLAFRDVTEQSRLEDEILKADKLESLGLLAGGIAHDFNNLLTGILGNIGLAKIFIGSDHKSFTRLEVAEKAIERSKDLTQQLLTFSRGGVPVKMASSIEQIVRDSVSFSLRGANVKCEFSITEGIAPIEVDEGQMSRVINNLIINASQSMPDGGIINIKIENAVIRKADNLPINEGRYVLISVQDHGIGIHSDNLNKIFDPYFTTKKKGSGLGLAVAYSIVKNHNGHISVHSKLNEGTTFQVYLPAAEEILSRIENKNQEIMKGKGKILIMDDEEIIRDVANELLEHLGYEAVGSKDGEEALRLYKNAMEDGKPFDAIIMDLTIPGAMGGRDLMTILLQYDPKVKAIVSSGYYNDPIMSFYKDFGFSGVVLKPYKIKEFSEVLHKALNSELQ